MLYLTTEGIAKYKLKVYFYDKNDKINIKMKNLQQKLIDFYFFRVPLKCL